MAKALHKGHSGVVVGIFEGHLVGNQLIMESRLGQCLCGGEILVDDMNDVLDCCCNDSASTSTASN